MGSENNNRHTQTEIVCFESKILKIKGMGWLNTLFVNGDEHGLKHKFEPKLYLMQWRVSSSLKTKKFKQVCFTSKVLANVFLGK